MRTMHAEVRHGAVVPQAIGPARFAARRFRAT
jgi:hypothetical protein